MIKLVVPAIIRYALALTVCCILQQTVADAQLCTGSLGDPIVNIDFGSGTAPRGAPLDAGITNYIYSSSGGPSDGYYAITKSTSGMNANWFGVNDHTDGSGYMMLVNASSTPGEFYRVSVGGLCPGMKYEAAVWVMNLLTGYDGLKPDITMKIETPSGQLLGEYNTGNVPQSNSPVWLHYGFYFTTPSNISEVILIIRNNGLGGMGNDLVLDDITFRPCGPDVNVSASLPGTNLNFCEGDNVNTILTAEISNEFTDPVVQWQRLDGASWINLTGRTSRQLPVTLTNAAAGTYSYRLAVGEPGTFGSEKCRVNSNVFSINVNKKPNPVINSNGPVCYGSNLILTASGGSAYSWTGPHGFTSREANPVVRNVDVSAAGIYHVTVTSPEGCTADGQIVVSVVEPPVAGVGPDVSICEGSSATLQATGGTTYIWSPADGVSDINSPNPIVSPVQTTTYTVRVSNGSCTSDANVTVNVFKPAIANAGPDKLVLEGDSVVLDGEVRGSAGFSYYWSPSDYLDDPNVLHPKAGPISDITYTLHAVSNTDCSSTNDQVVVKVLKKLIIPNTFSPNGDGINDIWNIEALESYPQSDIKIFNRSGAVVFSETGYTKAWDGKYNGADLPVGVYYYIIVPKPALKNEIYKGWVTIIR